MAQLAIFHTSRCKDVKAAMCSQFLVLAAVCVCIRQCLLKWQLELAAARPPTLIYVLSFADSFLLSPSHLVGWHSTVKGTSGAKGFALLDLYPSGIVSFWNQRTGIDAE